MNSLLIKAQNVEFSNLTLPQVCETILSTALEKKRLTFHLCNASTIYEATKDSNFLKLLVKSDFNICDGTPLAWYFSFCSGKKIESVRGYEIFTQVLRFTDRNPEFKHLIIGGDESSNLQTIKTIQRKYGNNLDVKMISPRDYSDFLELAKSIDDIQREFQFNIVWIALGTPKQDFAVEELLKQGVSCPIIPIGAALDFVSGKQSQAPTFLRHSGFEWIYRLIRNPRRLAKRYILGNLTFLFVLVRDQNQRLQNIDSEK